MDVNNLKTNELTYELELRQFANASQLPVDEKRKLLRGCFKQESSHRSFVEPTNIKPFASDIKGALETYNDLIAVVNKFTGVGTEKKKVEDRLTHLSNRINKFLPIDDQQMTEKTALQTKVIALEGEFEMKLDALQFYSQNQNVLTSTPTALSANVNIPQVPTRPSVPPYKWNTYFNGSTDRESVMSFLERIEELRISRNVSGDDLFRSACDIFKGPAWTWFSTNRHNFKNWDDVVVKLKSDFLPYFYEQDLLREISNRTMGNSEKVTLYIASMESLYNKLSTVPDEKSRVDQIRRNLLPYYINQLALLDINTISELSNLCKRLEESRSWSDRYKAPPNRRTGLLEPELSSISFSHNNYITDVNAVQSDNILNTKIARSCWNCGKVGHGYSTCRFPRKVFCYGCGEKNIIKSKCNSCSKNLNLGGGRQHTETVTVLPPALETPSTSSNQKNHKKKSKNK